MSDQLIGVFLGGMIGLCSSLIIFFMSYGIDRRREDRERSNWQLANVNTYYFDQYLSEKIKKCREELECITGNDLGTLKTLREDQRMLSHALQRVGVMMYLGSIPLSYGLVMNAYQIVHDWLLIAPFVKEIRGDDSNRNGDDTLNIPYQRRHAEWLALTCWMWLVMQPFSANPVDTNDLTRFEKYYGDKQKALSREKALFKCESRLAAPSTVTLERQIRLRFSFWIIKARIRFFIAYIHRKIAT